jgi:anti-sigma-K factor RskA
MLAYPATQTIGFDQNGVTGSLLVDRQRDLLAVFAWHLPAAPAGKTYQVWLIDARGDRTSGGFLEPEADYPFVSAVIRSPAPLSGFTGFGVTTEPVGGSPAPTGSRVFGASF